MGSFLFSLLGAHVDYPHILMATVGDARLCTFDSSTSDGCHFFNSDLSAFDSMDGVSFVHGLELKFLSTIHVNRLNRRLGNGNGNENQKRGIGASRMHFIHCAFTN